MTRRSVAYPVQRTPAGRVARTIAEAAYRDYSRRHGTSQSLDRLAERGGFNWAEIVGHLWSELEHLRAVDRGTLLTHRDPRFDEMIDLGPRRSD